MEFRGTGVHGAFVRGGHRTLAALLVLAALSAGCNSTDALIPPLDVGVTTQSTPLTQQDLDRASANTDQYARQQMAQQQQPVQSSNSYQQPYPSQNTLDAQAQALQSEQYQQSQQRLSTRLYQQPAPGSQPTQNQMLPAPVQQQQETSLSDEVSEQPPAPQEEAKLVQPGLPGTIRFLPIIGAPVSAVTPLSRELGTAARNSGLTILPSADQNAGNILKGYLSAFEDGSDVNIVYVWDILDAGGNRIHRLQGQKKTPKTGNVPWDSATTNVMQEIARQTIADYSQWKNDHKN